MEGIRIGRLINSIVDKLAEQKNQSSVVQDLQQHLVNLKKGFVDKIAWRREINLRVQAWIFHVRNLVQEIEDWIDKTLWMPKKGVQQKEIEEEIKNFQAQIVQACELCEGCIEEPTDLHTPAVVPSKFRMDPRLVYEAKTRLVAVDCQADKFVNLLMDKQVSSSKVLSIVGTEGLGKTTLAKEVYTRLQLQGAFDCQAFITLGQTPSLKDILTEILRQVKPSQAKKVNPKVTSGSTITQYLQKLITELREYLSTRRYFVLLDGIWSTRHWKVINCALPNENRGSRVLTTTCISDVAKCCSVGPTDVYQMEALSEKMSRRLYFNTIHQKEWPAHHDEVTKNMLQLCGGLPLGIIVIAGLFTMNSQDVTVPKMFEKYVLSSMEQHSTSEEMMKILHMSYADMSLPLRSCFLYLSVFREDYIIKKDRLIRFWGAEGFIHGDEDRRDGEKKDEEKREVKSLWEKGEGYFNELIMRRLIQPVFDYDDDQAVGCTVHGVILDFIRSLSSKGNFVTHAAGLNSGLFPGSTNTVRRFSLDCYNEQHQGEDGTLASVAVHLSRVRSITVLGSIEGMDGRSALTVSGKIGGEPVLPSFKHTRVLDLEDTDKLGSRHLEGIRGLVLLKHLGVAGTDIDKLPEEIGELEQLVTLDLRHTKLKILPASIAKQKRLAHLLIDNTVKVPSVILKMQGLEEISTIGIDSSSSIDSVVELLRKSERLRVLGVRLDGLHLSSDNKSVRSFLREVAGSTKLTSLSLHCVHIDVLGLLREFPPSDKLQRFELKITVQVFRGTAPKLASLVSVTHIDITVSELEDGGVRVLGGLPNLVLLKLVSSGVNQSITGGSIKSRYTVGLDHGFERLQVFSFTSRFGGTELQFIAGALPELRRFSLCLVALDTLSVYGNFSFGIEHLCSLTRVHATINCNSATASEVQNAEDAIRRQAGNSTTEFMKIHEKGMMPDHKVKTATPPNISYDTIITSLRDFVQQFLSLVHSRPVSSR